MAVGAEYERRLLVFGTTLPRGISSLDSTLRVRRVILRPRIVSRRNSEHGLKWVENVLCMTTMPGLPYAVP